MRLNSELNEREYRERKIILESYPRSIFVQMDAPCNQDCLFCSRPESYTYFNLEEFRGKFESKLGEAFSRAEKLLLTGSGELLCLPEAKKNLKYFNRYKFAEKMFATNGTSLTPKMLDFLIESGNKYDIHISIHSSNRGVHGIMTNSASYDVLMDNLKYIKSVKKSADKLAISFVFLMTTRNVEDLPAFVDFAREHGADNVIAYYNYVYRKDQKDISCYFAKEKANFAIDAARTKINREGHGFRVNMPPKFNEAKYEETTICGEAWSQIMVNTHGDIITCDVAGDSKETLMDKDFMSVWNGNYFTNIRKMLLAGDRPCSKYCFRANPACVNEFRSHMITRGKTEEEILKFIEQ